MYATCCHSPFRFVGQGIKLPLHNKLRHRAASRGRRHATLLRSEEDLSGFSLLIGVLLSIQFSIPATARFSIQRFSSRAVAELSSFFRRSKNFHFGPDSQIFAQYRIPNFGIEPNFGFPASDSRTVSNSFHSQLQIPSDANFGFGPSFGSPISDSRTV